MLGYDLYSSALADILSEPTMQPPICVGLYAQWGSGKSFLLKKLEGMKKNYFGNGFIPAKYNNNAFLVAFNSFFNFGDFSFNQMR